MITRETEVHDCLYCDGKGWIIVDFNGDVWVCWDCDGRGEVCNLCLAPWMNNHSCSVDAEDIDPQ